MTKRAQYEEARAMDPENADAQLYIGALLAEEGKYEEAVKYFEGLTKNKKFANTYLAWYYVGRIRVQQNTPKSIELAEKAFDKALSVKPDFSDAALALAAVYQNKGKVKKAIDLLAAFQDRHGPNANVAEVLAPLYMDQEKFDQAYQQFEIAAESDPDDLNVILKMAHILFTQKKYDAAISQLEKLLARVPDSDKVRYFLAAVYMEKGSYDLAIKNFEQVPPASPLYLQAVVLQAHSYRVMEKKDKALAVLKEALKIRKDVPQFYSSLAALLSENKDYEQAMLVIREGVERFPNNTDLRFLLGTLFDKIGKVEQTIDEMNKVLEVNPDHAQALNYVAYTYADQNKNLDQAEAMARRASEIEPEDGYIMDTLGWTLYKQGRVVEAIRALEIAFKLKADESVIAEHLGDAYYKNQMTNKARLMYKKALELEKNEGQVAKIKSKLMALEAQSSRERLPASKKSK
jgi:tetratricopeptide (TPR) repeat protein